jgi:hypothetical protein
MKSSGVIISVDIAVLTVEAQAVSVTLHYDVIVTQLIAREHFIAFSRADGFKSCIICDVFINGLCIK